MKYISSILLCIILSQVVNAQPVYKDTYWKLGRHAGLDFSTGIPNPILTDNCQSTMNNTSTQICDRNNHVIFYSNALYVTNRLDNIMPNGTCNAGTISSQYLSQDFYPPAKAAVIIPFPNDSNKFYMFYENLEWSIDGDYQPEKLYYLIVDKTLDGGLGDVTLKDQIVIQYDTLTKGEVLAVKHGNGKDWWIVCRKFKSNRYYKILVDASGVHQPVSQDIGIPYTEHDAYVGICNQTLDGEKMVFGYSSYEFSPLHPCQVDVFDFDRCTGSLSNNKCLIFPNVTDSIFWGEFCFSPNNRFLYCSEGVKIWQLDLTAANIPNSKILVGTFINTGGLNSLFAMKIGPDNRIYIGPYGSGRYVHVIKYPDSLGVACQFQQDAIDYGGVTTWADGGMPNVPNFALGPKAPCGDGVENIQTAITALDVFPNPSNGTAKISSPNDLKTIIIYNLTGNIVEEASIKNEKKYELNVSNFFNGVYLIEAEDKEGLKQYKKLIVQH